MVETTLTSVYDMLSSVPEIPRHPPKAQVDPHFCIRKEGKELLLVQVYVDDIIFAASTPELCDLFAKIMCLKFKMSMNGKNLIFPKTTNYRNLRASLFNQIKNAHKSFKENTVLTLVMTQWILPCGESQTDEDKKGKLLIRPTIVHDWHPPLSLLQPSDLIYQIVYIACGAHCGSWLYAKFKTIARSGSNAVLGERTSYLSFKKAEKLCDIPVRKPE
ncbi:hypothetical protein Tco_0890914 [Tanacetum coccineum]|uniref:Reverse transcriptase Ty1/copia-type domain-containing protein n=1 Tax=Tanacetum coccineum TaxID=301880 RepID=A0ABQ5C3M1_9ASTR